MKTARAGRSAAASVPAGEPSTRWRRPSDRLTDHRKSAALIAVGHHDLAAGQRLTERDRLAVVARPA